MSDYSSKFQLIWPLGSTSHQAILSQHVGTNQLSLLWTSLEICASKTRLQPGLCYASVPSLYCGHMWTISVPFSTLQSLVGIGVLYSLALYCQRWKNVRACKQCLCKVFHSLGKFCDKFYAVLLLK